ncbi:hypothetical protein HK096_006849 [Nowakowskiella sp. JEL0078]|nr:hypothetical protein HK096_006849 [Nowakowskiella sp. JEL0078]
MGGKVTRTYVLSVGKNNRHIICPGQYNERLFQALDSAISIARHFNIRLIIPLVDQWEWWGGIATWAGFREKTELSFFEDDGVIRDFFDMVTWVLNRRNTITGVRYGDDPTILGWETGNELGGWDYTPPSSWTIALAEHIKSMARQLVIDGTLGGTNKAKFSVECLKHPAVDVFTNHYYISDSSSSYSRQLSKDLALTKKYKKAFFVGEYGFESVESYRKMLKTAVEDEGCSGTLIWSLRFLSEEGGFYVHKEDKGFVAFHYPGFENKGADGFAENEREVIQIVQKFARPGWDGPIIHDLEAPVLLKVCDCQLCWRGSTGATSYLIWRKFCSEREFFDFQNGIWNDSSVDGFEIIGEAQNNVKAGEFGFRDNKAEGRYFYRVQAVGWTFGVIGKGEKILSAISNIILS